MDIASLLKSLEAAGADRDLLVLAPVVGPGAVISNHLEWSAKFSEGRKLFYQGDYASAAQKFQELNAILPGLGRFTTPARINELCCHLALGHSPDYINEFEPLLKQRRVYATVLWNLAYAYAHVGRRNDAAFCVGSWLDSPVPVYHCRALLLMSLYETSSGHQAEAAEYFEAAWRSDKTLCVRIIAKHLGSDLSKSLLLEDSISLGSTPVEQTIVAKEEVITTLQGLLVPRAPAKYTQLAFQLSEFEFQSGYVTALEKFGDGDTDGALKIIDSLLKGTQGSDALVWAKFGCLVAKRQWGDGIVLIEGQLNDPGIPGDVLWNASCAYFSVGNYESALTSMVRCADREYRTSAVAWLVQGLLAHLCGRSALRNSAMKEAIRISPKQLVPYISVLRQVGVDLAGLTAGEAAQGPRLEEGEVLSRYESVVTKARVLLSQGKSLEAAELFLGLAPGSCADIPEVTDTTFKPVILPTCPAALYDHKALFLSGLAAYQRRAYEEAVQKFDELYSKADRNYAAAVNLGASLVMMERHSRAIDLLVDAIQKRERGGAYGIRNLICAYMRSNRPEHAFPWFNKLLENSAKEYFNFVQMAYVAEVVGRKEDVATALFNAFTLNLLEPSIRLKAGAVKACLAVGDRDRAAALVKYFVTETPLPYVVAGATRPFMLARDSKLSSAMARQYRSFRNSKDARAALAYFQEVHSARESDYGSGSNAASADALFNACRFYGSSLFWNGEDDRAHEVLRQALGILTDHGEYYAPTELSKRYYDLTELYLERRHYFWASELCGRGLEADSKNLGLLRLGKQIETKIEEIPERSRSAVKELGELALDKVDTGAELLGLLPKVRELIGTLPEDFPGSKVAVSALAALAEAACGLEEAPIVKRKKEILRLREMAGRVERDLPLYLPRTFIPALLLAGRAIKKVLEAVSRKSICPEFSLVVEPVSYYREAEASLVFKVRNVGAADIHALRVRMDSDSPQQWAPVLEDQSFGVLKKDGLLWVDFPIHFDVIPKAEAVIRPRFHLNFTGGSLRGEAVEEVVDDQEVRLMPFVDITVDYPVVALRPEEGSKLYGRENLLRTLRNSFTRSGQARIPFLEGVRKVGKTSILYFLAGRISDGLLPVYVNLDTTWSNAYRLLARRISDEIVSRTGCVLGSVDAIETREDFEGFLSEGVQRTGLKRVVLLLDEFHVVIERIERRSLGEEFLGDLRYLYMNPRQTVAVAFADWYLIDELRSRVGAQLWTDFAREPITFLTELDTREAILSPAQGSPIRFEREVVSRIYYWTNGYPWHIQWICSELVNHLNTQKRYVAIFQDVDLIAQRLLREDRLFNEGVCRPERLTRDGQCAIYGLLELSLDRGGDICGWFKREDAASVGGVGDIRREIGRLVQLEMLLEDGENLRFCSPLHAMWFETKRRKGIDVFGCASESGQEKERTAVGTIPEDPVGAVRERCEELKRLKSELRLALRGSCQIFKNLEMPESWENASVLVQTRDSWGIFVKALRELFVEDMVSELDEWTERRKYSELNRVLHSIRQRRNVLEHPDSEQGRQEEERCCQRDLGKLFPTSASDWLALQWAMLDHIGRALSVTIERIARTPIGTRSQSAV